VSAHCSVGKPIVISFSGRVVASAADASLNL